MGDDGADQAVPGVVEDIDGEVARILIGADEEEWFFPLTTLPDGVEEGNVLGFVRADGRYRSTGFLGSRQTENSIQRRLSRGINQRRGVARGEGERATPGAGGTG